MEHNPLFVVRNSAHATKAREARIFEAWAEITQALKHVAQARAAFERVALAAHDMPDLKAMASTIAAGLKAVEHTGKSN